MTPARGAMVVAGVGLGRRTLTLSRPDRQRLGAPRAVAECCCPATGRHGATAIVLVHNDPSDDATPSVDDVAPTERLEQAGTLMGIEVVDHVILADTAIAASRRWHACRRRQKTQRPARGVAAGRNQWPPSTSIWNRRRPPPA